MAAVGIANALDVVGEILWRQTMQASVNKHSQRAETRDRASEGLAALV